MFWKENYGEFRIFGFYAFGWNKMILRIQLKISNTVLLQREWYTKFYYLIIIITFRFLLYRMMLFTTCTNFAYLNESANIKSYIFINLFDLITLWTLNIFL